MKLYSCGELAQGSEVKGGKYKLDKDTFSPWYESSPALAKIRDIHQSGYSAPVNAKCRHFQTPQHKICATAEHLRAYH